MNDQYKDLATKNLALESIQSLCRKAQKTNNHFMLLSLIRNINQVSKTFEREVLSSLSLWGREIPGVLLQLIFQFLKISKLFTYSLVSKRWHSQIKKTRDWICRQLNIGGIPIHIASLDVPSNNSNPFLTRLISLSRYCLSIHFFDGFFYILDFSPSDSITLSKHDKQNFDCLNQLTWNGIEEDFVYNHGVILGIHHLQPTRSISFKDMKIYPEFERHIRYPCQLPDKITSFDRSNRLVCFIIRDKSKYLVTIPFFGSAMEDIEDCKKDTMENKVQIPYYIIQLQYFDGILYCICKDLNLRILTLQGKLIGKFDLNQHDETSLLRVTLSNNKQVYVLVQGYSYGFRFVVWS